MTTNILMNKLITPDGTPLISRHVHDMVSHVDTITGECYSTDGGTQYLRRSSNIIPATDASVYTSDPHEYARQHFEWGTYGPKGDIPLHYVTLNTMSTEHIKAILKTQTHITDDVRQLFIMELVYRNEKGDE